LAHPRSVSLYSSSSPCQLQTHEVVEVCAKILYQVELNRGNLETMWGFSVEAELVEDPSERQDELCCYVSRVEERSVAMTNGIIKGDEIMVINGAIVSDLDMMFIESVLQEEIALCMMMRSSRTGKHSDSQSVSQEWSEDETTFQPNSFSMSITVI